MKILILTNKMPYPPKDGGSIATMSLAQELSRLGASIDLLAMNTSKHSISVDDLPTELTQQIPIHTVSVNTEVKITKLLANLFFSSLPYNATRFISPHYQQKLVELLQSTNYDIVQLEGVYLCPYIATIRQYSKAKIALRAHNVEYEIWKRLAQHTLNPLKKLYLRSLARRIHRFEKSYLSAYDYLIPITERDGNHYQQMGCPVPQQVVPTGISQQSALFSIDNQWIVFPSLFFIGALDWLPNQEGLKWFVEHVWDRFFRRYPATFTVAGRNAPDSFVRYLKRHNIKYIGEVENAVDLYSHQAIMVVPLLSGSGMRVKVIEGMAAGKVMVSTSLGAEGIPVADGENILLADDPDTFYEQLQRVYTDFQYYLQLSAAARTFVKRHYDNATIAQQLLSFYASHNI